VNEVGLPDHVPVEAVKDEPSFAAPLIVGTAVFCAAAAAAAPAKTPAAARQRQRRRDDRFPAPCRIPGMLAANHAFTESLQVGKLGSGISPIWAVPPMNVRRFAPTVERGTERRRRS
jgi:hypothetical protein